jgi:glutathione synthase/RimK-type ligase-like ATP-grasp enzyme
MVKKVIFSAKKDHDVIKGVTQKLKEFQNIKLIFHDPTQDFLDLENMEKMFGDVDFFVVKVGSECSLDLLHFAKIHNIPCLHDIDTVLTCKNKVALDCKLRNIFLKNSKKLKNFCLPKSWTQSLLNVDQFKKWAFSRLPIVIKSRYQQDKYNRFNFLVRKIDEIDEFCKLYSNFLNYDVYIQEFVECDGIDRKVYVVGDRIFGIKRANPIYIFLKEQVKTIDVDVIERESYEITNDVRYLAEILSQELKLKIFGFDLIKPLNQNYYYLIDLNEFPGFRGIKNIENVLAEFIYEYINLR